MKQGGRWGVAAVMLSCAGLVHCGSGALPAVQGPVAVASQEVAQPAPSSKPKVDLVFALDTTGSMGGLIQGAKTKIWEIARRAQEGKPAPELRVGLVAYRDVGDEYVTRVLELTSDLDKVYATLSDFQAGGGGDGPEHVLKGLTDAVEKMPWSDDRNAVKLVYLVGDAPPHLDYHDGITMETVLRAAKDKGIRISAIRCGEDGETLAAFTRIARPTDGEVATIEQTGGVVAEATPYDDKLAKLNAELAATEVHLRLGRRARRRRQGDRPEPGRARRRPGGARHLLRGPRSGQRQGRHQEGSGRRLAERPHRRARRRSPRGDAQDEPGGARAVRRGAAQEAGDDPGAGCALPARSAPATSRRARPSRRRRRSTTRCSTR